jgi:hypothetical protein
VPWIEETREGRMAEFESFLSLNLGVWGVVGGARELGPAGSGAGPSKAASGREGAY